MMLVILLDDIRERNSLQLHGSVNLFNLTKFLKVLNDNYNTGLPFCKVFFVSSLC